MNDVVARAVEAVTRERGGKFEEAFGAVAALVPEFGEASLANRLIQEIPSTIPWEVAAHILGILEWSTSDNGAAIHRETEQWLLDGQDLRRMRIALHLDCYPFPEEEMMIEVLERLAASVPELATRCRVLIQERKALPRQ